MAILDGIPGVDVHVEVKGEPLEEYNDDEDYQPQSRMQIPENRRAKVASKYVRSITGEQFTVNIVVGQPYVLECPNLEFRTRVDGIDISSYHLNKSEYNPDRPRNYAVRGRMTTDVENQTRKLQPFQFSRLETVIDDDSKLAQLDEDTVLVKEVGEIVVSVHRKSEPIKIEHARDDIKPEPGNKTSKSAQKQHNNNRPEIKPLPTVHEKALKGSAKSHTTSYGREQVTKISNLRNWSYGPSKYLDGRNNPIAIFRFKYRSEKALKQLLILKRTPEPDVVPIPSPSTPTQPSRLNNNQDSSGASKDKDTLKREGDQAGSPSKRARKSVVQEIEVVEVVDLTGD